MPTTPIYCFRASYELSETFNEQTVPDWLCLGTDWQGYTLCTVPEVADVARVLGVLEIEDTASEWISHLENLGLRDITPVACEEMFEAKGYY